MLSETYLLRLTERQRRIVPALAARYEMPGGTRAFILAAVDAAIASCSENDEAAAAIVRTAEQASPKMVLA